MAALDQRALELHPEVRAAGLRADEAAISADVEEGRWPEPRVEYMAEISTPWASHMTTSHMVTLMQTLPWAATRKAQAAPALARERGARAEERAAAHGALRDLRVELVNIARTTEMIRLLEEEQALVSDVLQVLETTLATTEREHSDLYRLRLAEENLVDQRREQEGLLAGSRGRLAQLLGQAPEDISLENVASILTWSPELPSREQLRAMIEEGAPALAIFEAQASAARAQEELSERQLRPPPQVMLGYANMPPMFAHDAPRHDAIRVGFSIALPVWGGRYSAEARRWQAAAQAAGESQAQRLRELLSRMESARARVEQADARLDAFEAELVPLAEALSEQVLIGVETGERSVTDYLGAVREERTLHTRRLGLQAERATQLLELQYLSGGLFAVRSPWAYPPAMRGQ
ncbi:hypothetical protein DL240_06445 [Lujinxingia litoralis]|uniref:TolC family protein n=2 Tax=Lujinxingia litoralis TaxID=2211119 RepID=A0A328CBC5_9DELT|nr:hypothetical protein DL240_06445 [Lujinxingia litoralis]